MSAKNRFSEADLMRMNLKWNEREQCYEPKGATLKEVSASTKPISSVTPIASDVAEQPVPANPVYWKNMNLVQVFEWCERNEYIFIPGHVPSSKNHRINFVNKAGRQMSLKSKSCTKYIKESSQYYEIFKAKFLKSIEDKKAPYIVSFKFIRGNRSKFDLINPLQTVQDIMVDAGWIEDDNADVLIPHFKQYVYDKHLPGVLIKVL